MKLNVKVLALLAIAGLGNSLMGMDGRYIEYDAAGGMISFAPNSSPVKKYGIKRTMFPEGPIYTEFTEWRANPGSMTSNEGNQALLAQKYNELVEDYRKHEDLKKLAALDYWIKLINDVILNYRNLEDEAVIKTFKSLLRRDERIMALEQSLEKYEAEAAPIRKRLAQ